MQELRNTTWRLIYEQSKMEVGYFKDVVQVDTASSTAYVDEIVPTLYSMNRNNAVFTESHLSRYLLSTAPWSGKTAQLYRARERAAGVRRGADAAPGRRERRRAARGRGGSLPSAKLGSR